MRKMLAGLLAVLLICSFALAQECKPIFQKVKDIALTAQPNENGHYFQKIKKDGVVYVCAWLPEKNCIGTIMFDGLNYFIVEFFEGRYGASIVQNGVIVMQQEISEKDALDWTEDVLRKFELGIKM